MKKLIEDLKDVRNQLTNLHKKINCDSNCRYKVYQASDLLSAQISKLITLFSTPKYTKEESELTERKLLERLIKKFLMN